MRTQFPYSVTFDLNTLSDRVVELSIEPGPSERAAIAEWLDAAGIEALTASVRLKRLGEDRFRYEARYCADVVQRCVVTLDPVHSHLEAEFAREYRIGSALPVRKARLARSHVIADLNEEDVEELDGPVLDIAAPLIEEIGLALDPYPRAPGAAFAAAGTDVESETVTRGDNPFAILSRLKETSSKSTGGGSANRSKSPKKQSD
jgi:uncharacterized metal-binding protein YceD (DUF177 family)